ncbi:MAG: ABC transporter permease [Acidobacteriota bacterium]
MPWAFLLRRLASAAVLLLIVLSATFALIYVAPGDPFSAMLLDPRVGADAVAALRAHYGLDQPLVARYLRWLVTMLSGDWGPSYVSGRPAFDLLREALPYTALLAGAATLVQYLIGLPLGALAAVRADRVADHAVRVVSLLLYAMPSFWLALLAMELFTVRLGWLPTGAPDFPPDLALGEQIARALRHVALPAATLGVALSADVLRYTRNGLLDVLQQDHVRAARARGLGARRVLWRHALPTAAGPLVHHAGVQLPALFSGVLIIEVIFAWPGVGRIAYDAILSRDLPVVLAATALSGALVVLGTLGADLLHGLIDPRTRRA